MGMEKADLSSLRIHQEKRQVSSSPVRTDRNLRRWIVILLALLLLGGGSVAVVFLKGSRPLEVQLGSAILRSPAETQSILTASGYVVAQRKAALAASTTGLLVELNVREGDRVQPNEVIARLKDDDYRAQLAEAEASLAVFEAERNEARNNLRRKQELVASGLSAEVELETAQTRFDRLTANIAVAKARIDAAKVALDNTIIRAPFAGTVLTKNADVGEIVSPMAAGVDARAAVVTIADLASLEVEADVSESNIEKVQPGGPCIIQLDAYPGRRYAGKVLSIIPTADRTKGTVEVKIGFDEYDHLVLPEMSARVTFIRELDPGTAIDTAPLLVIPADALARRDGRQVVFRVIDGRAVLVEVETGGTLAEQVVILSGLKSGDSVIRRVPQELLDGAPVSVR